MHESKGQHIGKAPSLHLFHTTVRQCMRVFLKRITNSQPLLAVHGCSLVLRPLPFSHVAWERPSWQHHAIKNLFNNLRPQFVDFQFLIRCFTCTQHGRAGITIMHLSNIHTKELEYDARRISARYTPVQKGYFGCRALDRHICQRYAHCYAHLACSYAVI